MAAFASDGPRRLGSSPFSVPRRWRGRQTAVLLGMCRVMAALGLEVGTSASCDGRGRPCSIPPGVTTVAEYRQLVNSRRADEVPGRTWRVLGMVSGVGGNSTVFYLRAGDASVVVDKWRCGLFQTQNYLDLTDGDIVIVVGRATGSGWLCGAQVEVIANGPP